MSRRWLENYDTDQPWVIYRYGRTHDKFWPPWSSSRILGYAKIGCLCMICGQERVVKARLPRFGEVNPENNYHPERTQFLLDHIHFERPPAMAWAKPLWNLRAHPGGKVDLEALAIRLEADLAADQEGAGTE